MYSEQKDSRLSLMSFDKDLNDKYTFSNMYAYYFN